LWQTARESILLRSLSERISTAGADHVIDAIASLTLVIGLLFLLETGGRDILNSNISSY
jgi:hypothetical protein